MRCAAHGICSNKRLKCCAAVWAEHGPLSAGETSWLEGCRAGGQFVPLNVAQCASASTILRAWILEEYSMSIGSHGTWEDPWYPSFSLYQVANMNQLKKWSLQVVIGSYRIHLLLSWDALFSTVDTASYLEISFALRSVQLANRSNRRIGPDSAEKNAQSRETVKTLTPNFCQLNHVNSGVGKYTDFSHDPTKQEDMFKNAKNRTFPTRCLIEIPIRHRHPILGIPVESLEI